MSKELNDGRDGRSTTTRAQRIGRAVRSNGDQPAADREPCIRPVSAGCTR
jgi:hypothetical protein